MLLSEPQFGLTNKQWSKNKLKWIGKQNQTYWNENNGPNFLRQNVWFFRSFKVYKWIDFALEKFLSKLPPPSARNLDPTKTAFSEFFFPKNTIDVLVTSSCVQKMTHITEIKKRTSRTFWKAVFSVAPLSIKLLQKLNLKNGAWNGVWSVQEEHTSSISHVPFRFGVKIDRNQLMDSDISTKCRKRSQRKSLSFS